MKIKLNEEELKEILREKFNTKGNITFVFRKKCEKAGWTDGVQHYKEVYELESAEIEVESIKK